MRPTPYCPFHGHLLPSVSNGSIPSLSVSSAFVASQILFGPSGLLLARARSARIARAIIRCARVVQGCKDCAWKCVHLARAIIRCARLCCARVRLPWVSHNKMCKGCARKCIHLARATFISISGFSQSRSLSCTVVKPSRQEFNEHPVVGPSMKKFNVECV